MTIKFLNCNEIPQNWDVYTAQMQTLITSVTNCIDTNIATKQSSLSNDVIDRINFLLTRLSVIKPNLISSFNTLISYLSSAPLKCYDNSWYNEYIENYNNYKNIIFEINLLISTNGEFIGFDSNTDVNTKVIYPNSGGTSNNSSNCNGVYVKKMDSGSEFIGKITIT